MSFLLSILTSINVWSAFAFNASADDVNTRFEISPYEFASKYPFIDGTYLGRDGQYHTCTFTYSGSVTVQNWQTAYYPNNISYSFSGRTLIAYQSDFYGSDLWNSDWSEIKVLLYPDFYFADCSYINTGFDGYMFPNQGNFFGLNYNSVKEFNYLKYIISSVNYSEKIYLGASDSSMAYPVRAQGVNGNHSGGIGFAAYESDTDIYIPELAISCVENQNSDKINLFFLAPIVSENTVLMNPAAPPDPPVTTAPVVTGNGSGSGSIVTNDSGVTQFNFNITNEFQVPSYLQSGSFSEYSDNFPQTVSGLVSDMDTYGTAAASDIAEMEDYDLSGFWDFFGRMIPLRVVAAILAVSWISLLGWILTKYRG